MRKATCWTVLTVALALIMSWPAWADDSDYYRIVPCKFQVRDKLGRTVDCPLGTTLAFQLMPGDGGLYLNGKSEVEVGDSTADANTWREATMGPNGIFEADLFAPVSDSAGMTANYTVRFKGGGNLNATSLNSGKITLSQRGTSRDIEPLVLQQSVRRNWEIPTIVICAIIALAYGWVKAASTRARVWEELTAKGMLKADAEANKKQRTILSMVVFAVIVGSICALVWPGVTGFFPYCGVILGAGIPVCLAFIIGLFVKA